LKAPLVIACVVEAATGLALLVRPALVVRLLLGSEIAGAGAIASRVAGIALFSLALACWPGKEPTRAALYGMTTYNLQVTLYLLFIGIRGESVGPLLWPVVLLHAILSLLLIRTWAQAGFGTVGQFPTR
jgi:hypothetical protein